MAAEVHAITTTVSATVTHLHGYPLKLVGDFSHVQVYPAGNKVEVTDGTLTFLRTEPKVFIPGNVVTMSNAVTASSGWLEIGHWEVLYSFTETPLPTDRPLTITYDATSGNFVASHPCYAGIKLQPFFATYDIYAYKPSPINKEVTTFDPFLNKEYKVSATFYGTAYSIHRFDPALMLPPVCVVFNIPMPNITTSASGNLYNSYSITTPTILTASGEYIRPAGWGTEGYDSSNAYGQGKAGPSATEPWVMKNSIVETGHVNGDGTVVRHTASLPAVIGSTEIPASQMSKYYQQHPQGNLTKEQYAASSAALAERAAYHGATELPPQTKPASGNV